VNVRVEFPTIPTLISRLYLPDFLILPFGHAQKRDLQRITLSAVSTDGLYFSTNVSVIFINKAERKPLCIGDFEKHFGLISSEAVRAGDQAILDYMCSTLKSHNPNMRPAERMFLELYFGMLKVFMTNYGRDACEVVAQARKQIGLDYNAPGYDKITDVWRALLPIPELQVYVNDPLAPSVTGQPDNNFRVDYGFWDGERLMGVELDGAEPDGYAKEARRDRLLRNDGLELFHFPNGDIMQHRARALLAFLPRRFFGFDWNYPSNVPDWELPPF
jgi:hypothetical protein